MGQLSIKVTIGNRVYPLTIAREEEEILRRAAKLVNENLKELERTYEVHDKQDLLAMTSLFFGNKSLLLEKEENELSADVSAKLNEIDETLSRYLEKV